MFCGNLYLIAFDENKAIHVLTLIGGGAFLVGGALLAFAAIKG